MQKKYKKINILGISIDNLDVADILLGIKNIIKKNDYHYAVTPNPEIILGALEDEELFYVINQADFAPVDGIGLKAAGIVMGKNLRRITGVALSSKILKLAQTEKQKVLIVNWNKGLSDKEKINLSLKKKYPDLNFLTVDIERERSEWEKDLAGSPCDFKPDIVFCTFGSPYQEKLVYHVKKILPSLKFGIGVGGAFDFISGSAKRSPKFFRRMGLEWLWRLGLQPKRAGRIFKAVIVFPYKFFVWRFVQPFLYRSNVACLLYKKMNSKIYIFIIERKDEAGHWQIPQGGLDNENVAVAGARELREEIGTNDFKPLESFKNVYRYKFKGESKMRGSRGNAGRFAGHKGQKQSLFVAEFLGQDSDIKLNFWDHSAWEWVELEKIMEKIHPCRREGMEKFLSAANLSNNKSTANI